MNTNPEKPSLPVVIDRPDRYFLRWIPHDRIYPVYKRDGLDYFWSRVKRKLRVFGHVPPLLHHWEKHLKKNGCVVFMDSALDEHLLKRLEAYQQQIILYMWNPMETVFRMTPAVKDYLSVFTVYSHDRSDCRQYGFKFNTTFYRKQPPPHQTDTSPPSDLVFIGANKNREGILTQIHQQLSDMTLSFHIMDRQQGGRQLRDGLALQSHELSYEQCLARVRAARGILEILQPGQDSLSLRAMESLFYQKKLVTNYRGIVNEDFHHPANVLVFEDVRELTPQRVGEFLASPYHPIDPQIVQRYEFESWLKQFETQ